MSANVSTSPNPADARLRERIQFAREMDFAKWIAERAGISYCGILAGCCSDRALRIARFRELILTHNLAERRVNDVRRETFAERFKRLYGVPLSDSTPALSPDSPTQLEVPL